MTMISLLGFAAFLFFASLVIESEIGAAMAMILFGLAILAGVLAAYARFGAWLLGWS